MRSTPEPASPTLLRARLELRHWLSPGSIRWLYWPDHEIELQAFGGALALAAEELLVGDASREGVHLYQISGTRRTRRGWAMRGAVMRPSAWHTYGGRIVISGDLLVVGDPRGGAVHLLRRAPPGFSVEAHLESGSDDGFGESLAAGGDTVFIGATSAKASVDRQNRPLSSPLGHGAVFVYRREGSRWNAVQTLRPSVTPLPDRALEFGDDVAYGAGLLAVGAPGERAPAPIVSGHGAVYLFERCGARWAELTRIPPRAAKRSAPRGRRARRLALAGNWLAVAEDEIYLYERVRRNSWVLRQVIEDYCGGLAIGRDWLVTSACKNWQQYWERLELRLLVRQGQRWVLVSRAPVPLPPLAAKHYRKATLTLMALASDGRWAYAGIGALAKRVPGIRWEYFKSGTSGVAIYEIVSPDK